MKSLLLFFIFIPFVCLGQDDHQYFIKGEEVRLSKGHLWSSPTSSSKPLSNEEYLEDAVAIGGLYDRLLIIASDTLVNGYLKVIDADENDNIVMGWIYAKNAEKKPIPRMIGSRLDTTYCLKYLDYSEWKKYNDQARYSARQHAELYAYIANEYFNYEMYQLAIFYYTKSINTSNNDYSKIKRAFSKMYLHDYHGCIKDIDNIKLGNKTYLPGLLLQIEQRQEDILNTKGYCKMQLKEYDNAVLDFSKSITLNKIENPQAYYYRGFCFIQTNQKQKACNDLSIAGEQGHKDAYKMIQDFCR